MLAIDQEAAATLKFDLAEAVADFAKAVDDHRFTINVPAPTAHPVVEEIVRHHGGKFQVVETETKLPPDDPNSLTARIASLEARIAKLEANSRESLK